MKCRSSSSGMYCVVCNDTYIFSYKSENEWSVWRTLCCLRRGYSRFALKKEVIVYLYVFLDIWMYDQIEDNVVVSMKFGSFVGLKEMYTELLCDLQIYLVNPRKILKSVCRFSSKTCLLLHKNWNIKTKVWIRIRGRNWQCLNVCGPNRIQPLLRMKFFLISI